MPRAALGGLAAALLLAGCASMGPGSKPLAYAASANGTIGLVGSQIGRDLAAEDQRAGIAAEYRALELGETGATVQWRGRPGVAGAVVPGPRYRVNDFDCRQFTETVMADAVTETGQATACRGTDGVWRLVS